MKKINKQIERLKEDIEKMKLEIKENTFDLDFESSMILEQKLADAQNELDALKMESLIK